MMELTCAVILISASLVSATPYGYGVKGGASARAESSASAGAFGGVGEIPVAVPLGAGYSGSFSKSSSASSSSASASSSSSSSSFSYSGSGAGGIGLNGGVQGNGGCSSGSCKIEGGNGIPASHGSSLAYNAANSAATAGAGAVSGPGCQGLSCDNHPEKCTSGQCKPKSQTGTASIDSDTNKCTSGQCGFITLENNRPPPEHDSNDIRVVSDSAHNAKDQSSSFDKTSTGYNGAGSDCSNGKCGPSGPLNSKPNYYGHDSGNSNQGSSTSNQQQQSSNSETGLSSHYQKPSPHLETPKLGSKCNSGNCNVEPLGPGHETSPSSYNVPIHGTYNNGEQKPTCDGVKCENLPKGPFSSTSSNSLSTNYINQQHSLSADNSVTKVPSSSDNPSSTNCGGSSCIGTPASQITGGPSFALSPGSLYFGQSPSNTPTLSPYPTNPATPVGSHEVSGHIGYAKPSDVNKPTNDKTPAYTGGFGGPTGVLNPNEFDVVSPTSHPSHAHAGTSQNGKPLGNVPTGCNSPSCSGYPSASGPNVQTGTYIHKPGGGVPSEKLPTYTGGFGGPAGMLKPNEFDNHATVTNRPSYAHPASSSYHTQPPASNIGATDCKTGNCGVYSPTADATSGATAPTGHFGTTKPNIDISSSENLPTYTGGFGGPGGVFSPDKYDIHATGPISSGHTPLGTYNSPTSGHNPDGCKTPNCYPTLGSTAAANAQAESFGITKPSSSPHLSSVTLPAYTSGYDRPFGVSRPNEIGGPTLAPSFTQTPSSPGGYSTGCKTGNCASYPSGTSGPSAGANAGPGSFGITKPNTDVNPASPNSPQYTGGFNGPTGTSAPNDHGSSSPGSYSTGCKTGNCASYPSGPSGPSAGANAGPGSFGIAKPNTGLNPASPTLPQYTGGFSGPSGTSKPNEHGYVTPSIGSASINCKTPNCVNSPTASSQTISGANAQSGSFGITQSGSFGTTKPSGGINLPNEKLPSYTGGFGGAPGLLKPNDYTSPAVSGTPNNNKPTGVSKPAACTSGNCNPHVSHGSNPHSHNDALNGAHATAAAAAEANAVAYTGGFGGPPGFLEPYDSGKVGGTPANGGPHGSQIGGANYGSHNAHIHSPHGTIPGANAGPTGAAGLGGAHGDTGAQAGSIAGSAAYAGAAASASSGAHGYNTHGSHYNQAGGNTKGGSPCGGGCDGTSGSGRAYNGGSSGGAYNGGSSFGFSGGHSLPKLGYSDELNGAGSISGAAAKSQAGANAFGVGGSFASSSASAHASAGAYTKGGYGKR